jgi:hypothetical protein
MRAQILFSRAPSFHWIKESPTQSQQCHLLCSNPRRILGMIGSFNTSSNYAPTINRQTSSDHKTHRKAQYKGGDDTSVTFVGHVSHQPDNGQ